MPFGISRLGDSTGIVRRPVHDRTTHLIKDYINKINWLHVAFKICVYSYFTFVAWIIWQILPLQGHWNTGRQSDKLPATIQDLSNYFDSFNGSSHCQIRASELYATLPRYHGGLADHESFCPNRESLLQAMSYGGRIGFDVPYITKGCQYRWYSVMEICMILERFDGLVFVGDTTLQSIYNGFNILLRRDLTYGALQTWRMNPEEMFGCSCDNQFTNTNCAQYYVTSSDEVTKNIGTNNNEHTSRYLCQRVPHKLVHIGGGKPTQFDVVDKFNQMVPKAPKSNYKATPIIHSLSPATASHNDAAASLLGYLKLAELSGRKTPMLWVGPTAAGHIEIRGRRTNQEIWDFDHTVAKVAVDNGIEVLKMWNLTVQASSWDGMRFGEKVAIVQAMMVINWLSRLESS